MAIPEPDDEGLGIIEDLAVFTQRSDPDRLADICRGFGFSPDRPADALRHFFTIGESSFLVAIGYLERCGRVLFVDVWEMLAAYFADLRRDPGRRLMYLSRDPEDQPREVSSAQQSHIMPPRPADLLRLPGTLFPLMRDLAVDQLDFRGEKHLIWVLSTSGTVSDPVTRQRLRLLREVIKPNAQSDESKAGAIRRLHKEGIIKKLPGAGTDRTRIDELIRLWDRA